MQRTGRFFFQNQGTFSAGHFFLFSKKGKGDIPLPLPLVVCLDSYMNIKPMGAEPCLL